MKIIAAAISFLLLPFYAHAQEVDYQARVLMHRPPQDGASVAGWVILPDLTQTDPFRILFVVGPAKKTSRGWVEPMVGAYVDDRGAMDPVVDLRVAQNWKWVEAYAETLYAFRAERLLITSNAVVPFRLSQWKFGVGLETDSLLWRDGRKSFSAGPRITVKLPGSRVKLSVAQGFQFGKAGRIARTYVVYAF